VIYYNVVQKSLKLLQRLRIIDNAHAGAEYKIQNTSTILNRIKHELKDDTTSLKLKQHIIGIKAKRQHNHINLLM
jgi:hypothetical protein